MRTAALALLLSLPAFGAITLVQSPSNQTAATCGSTSGTSCSLTITSTTGGNFGIVGVHIFFSGAIQQITGFSTDPCNVAWIRAANNNQQAGGNIDIDMMYCTSLKAGQTTLVATTAQSNSFRGIAFYELSSAIGFTFDTSCGAVNASGTNPPGCSMTLSGTNDFIAIMCTAAAGTVTVPTNYTLTLGSTGRAWARWNNTNNGTVGTWTDASSGVSAVNGLAIKEQSPFAEQIGVFAIGPL